MSIKGIKNCLLLTMDNDYPVYSKGAILWNDEGIIIESGSEDQIKTPAEEVEYSDGQGKLVMPGMVCTHGHLYSFLARGIALKDDPPENFQQMLEQKNLYLTRFAVIYKTKDGGKTWHEEKLPKPQYFNPVDFIQTEKGIFGMAYSGSGRVQVRK